MHVIFVMVFTQLMTLPILFGSAPCPDDLLCSNKESCGKDQLKSSGNVRPVFERKGFNLELDDIIYDLGTSNEIECDSKEPEKCKELIEGLLQGNGIEFSYSEAINFAVFRSGKLP
ncbi:hypothetical protein OIU74_013597 [Salix koriyanagi]|uniref:Uncharacterized protein n=1 Tax=Salix koriyanagi TaxID=2511006 RepID=A0A9Q0Q9G7_9ROSI|nr:hypothetical protein OIU74_013597 [Salix koriyanagi]